MRMYCMDCNIAEQAMKLVCYEKTEQRQLITCGGGLEMNFMAHLRKSIIRKICKLAGGALTYLPNPIIYIADKDIENTSAKTGP